MMDLWLLLDAAVAGSLAYTRGRVVGRRKIEAKIAEPPEPPEPVCGCGHHYSKHDSSGKCVRKWDERVLVERGQPKTIKTGPQSYPTLKTVYETERWEVRTYSCSCVRYTGPEPLPQVVAY